MSAPAVIAADVERLVKTLTDATAWMTAGQLSAAIYGADTDANKRRIRAIASAAGSGVVSFPGSPGYKLWGNCTVDELHACIAAYGSQSDDMRRRRDTYRIRLHREQAGRSQPVTDDRQMSFL